MAHIAQQAYAGFAHADHEFNVANLTVTKALKMTVYGATNAGGAPAPGAPPPPPDNVHCTKYVTLAPSLSIRVSGTGAGTWAGAGLD